MIDLCFQSLRLKSVSRSCPVVLGFTDAHSSSWQNTMVCRMWLWSPLIVSGIDIRGLLDALMTEEEAEKVG